MSTQSKPLPNELLSEIANCVPLKIVNKKCVIPINANASLLMASQILTVYLREKIQKVLQLISHLANPELYRNDESELCVTYVDGTALNSIDLLRHFCLNNVLFERKGKFTIKDHMLPMDFQPHQFIIQLMKYAAKCANPLTIANDICLYFPVIDENELPDILKIGEEEKEFLEMNPIIAAYLSRFKTLTTHNGSQKFKLIFSKGRRILLSLSKVNDDDNNNVESM